MTETKIVHETLPNQFELTQETALQLNDMIDAQDFTLMGHGTPAKDAESFFTHGITVGATEDGGHQLVTSTSLPLGVYDREHLDAEGQITNLDYMSDWPYQKWGKHPNVVLMALPNGRIDDESGPNVSAIELDGHMFEPSDGKSVFPPSLIVGFYNSAEGTVTLNPDLDITPEVREKYLQRAVAARKSAAAIMELYDGPVAPPIEFGHDDDVPLIW